MQTKLRLINVTQENIDNAKRNDGYSCPIALACSSIPELLGDDDAGPLVERGRIWKFESTVGYKLPLEAKVFVHAFDAGRKVKPFEFEIDLNMPKFR